MAITRIEEIDGRVMLEVPAELAAKLHLRSGDAVDIHEESTGFCRVRFDFAREAEVTKAFEEGCETFGDALRRLAH